MRTPKRESNALRLLRRLSDGRWHTSLDLVQHAGIRANGRLWDLRRKYGICVEMVRTGEDQFRYRWTDTEMVKAAVRFNVERAAVPVEPKQAVLI